MIPRLDRKPPAFRAGQIHLGPGAFFKAFNAIYTADAIAAAGGDWGIIAVSLRSTSARDQLKPQGCAYTSVELGTGTAPRVVQVITDVLVAPEDPQAVLTAMADPAIKVVSLTITEKGYCMTPSTGRLMAEHPDVSHDLEHPEAPRSAIGFLVRALNLRRQAGAEPFTVLSCDNLPSNGAVTRQVTLDFARLLDSELASWIETHVRFPSIMVDRITPATTPQDIADLAASQGYHDPACVLHEGFRQWVIEDAFVTDRPSWELAGAQFVQSVDTHELMKLRCLNGTHSTLAYLGYLAGYETIAETVADPNFAELCKLLWRDEITPTVPQPEGEDLPAYCNALLVRYRNSAIRHRTWQIAMDGSQKVRQRLLGTIQDNLARGHTPTGLCIAVAGWLRYVGGVDENGAAIDVRDPMADQLRATSDRAADPQGKVEALLAIEEVFTPSLTQDPAFRSTVSAAYCALLTRGAKAVVADHVARHGRARPSAYSMIDGSHNETAGT